MSARGQITMSQAEVAAFLAGARAAAKRVGVIMRPARTVSWDHRKLATGH